VPDLGGLARSPRHHDRRRGRWTRSEPSGFRAVIVEPHMHGNCRPLAAASSRRADVQSFRAFGHCERALARRSALEGGELAGAAKPPGPECVPAAQPRRNSLGDRTEDPPRLRSAERYFACPDAQPGLRSWPADGLASAHCRRSRSHARRSVVEEQRPRLAFALSVSGDSQVAALGSSFALSPLRRRYRLPRASEVPRVRGADGQAHHALARSPGQGDA
jgi:hypothetical protein